MANDTDAHDSGKYPGSAPTAGGSGGPSAGAGDGAGRATRDVVRRVAGANPASRSDLAESNARQKAALSEQYARGEEVFTHDPARRIGFAVSQRAIQGKEPSWNEVKRFMQDAGFRQVKAAGIDNTHMADKTWYRPDPGYVVSDVKPDNFKKDAAGRVIPFDLNVQRAEPGSDLRTAVEFNL